jgi:acetate kinase
MRTLVVNAGSSSVKLRVLDVDDAVVESTDLPARAGEAEPGAVRAAVEGLGPVDAVGHRVVHGGPHRTAAAMVDDELLAELRSLAPLAPLHQHAALDAIGAVADARPATPAVACFDTAFHASLPAAASTYALPEEWRERWPIRRFGFHGSPTGGWRRGWPPPSGPAGASSAATSGPAPPSRRSTANAASTRPWVSRRSRAS